MTLSMSKHRILVTGSAGRLGRATAKALRERGHFVRGFDLRPSPHADESITGSIADYEMFLKANTGMDVLIHLAATPDDDDFHSRLVPNNIVGVYNALESAKASGVKRVMLASSGQVVWWQRFTGPYPIRVDTPPTPRGWYASMKLFSEGAGRAFAEGHGLGVLAARLGWCPRDPAHAQDLADTDWGPDAYLSHRDCGRFFVCAVESPAAYTFAVLYAYSKPLKQATFDMEPSRTLIGYEPHDIWPEGALDDFA